MGQPKKQTSPRKTGLRRSHLRLELARRVNKTSPVKARTTKKESGKALAKPHKTAVVKDAVK
jgi:ribosomal protein L32